MVVVSEQDVDNVLRDIGVVAAPVRRDGVRTALTFFRRYMPSYGRATQLGILKAVDLSKPVRTLDLLPGELVVAYRHHTADWGEFHTRVGRDPRDLGIRLAARQYRRYQVTQRVCALESTTSAFEHMQLGSGGALQLIIPQAYRHLRVVHRGAGVR